MRLVKNFSQLTYFSVVGLISKNARKFIYLNLPIYAMFRDKFYII
nr:MAG TPA: hypothetical protein [Ackermannviridae sp.]